MQRILVFLVIAALAGCTAFGTRKPDTFIVFFDAGSTQLTPQAHSIVDSAVARIKSTLPKMVVVGSGTDSADNLKLAGPRFAAIRGALVAEGIDEKLVAQSSLPETDASVGAVAATRVEIQLVPAN